MPRITVPKSFGAIYQAQLVLGTVFTCHSKKINQNCSNLWKTVLFFICFINLNQFSHFPLKSRRICQELPYRNHSELFTRFNSFFLFYLILLLSLTVVILVIFKNRYMCACINYGHPCHERDRHAIVHLLTWHVRLG